MSFDRFPLMYGLSLYNCTKQFNALNFISLASICINSCINMGMACRTCKQIKIKKLRISMHCLLADGNFILFQLIK